MTEKIYDFSATHDLPNRETELLDAASNLRALVEYGTDNPDQAVADLVEETGEAFARGEATYRDTVIADEVGVQRALSVTASEDTLQALSIQPVKPLHDALDIAAHSEPEALDAVVQKLEEISSEHEHRVNPFESIVTPTISRVAGDFNDQHNMTHGQSVELPSHLSHQLSEQEIIRQNTIVDKLLDSKDRSALLALLNDEVAVDAGALGKIIDQVAVAAYRASPWSEDTETKTLHSIGVAIGEKLHYLPEASFGDTAGELIDKGGARALAVGVLRGDLPNEAVAALLLEKNEYSTLVGNIRLFPSIDKKTLTSELYKRGEAGLVLDNFLDFPEADPDELVEQVLALKDSSGLAYHIDAFPNVDKTRLVNRLYEQGKAYAVAGTMSHFPDIDKTELMLQCIEQESAYCLIGSPTLFEGADLAQVQERLLQTNNFEVLMVERKVFPSIPIDLLVSGLIEQRKAYVFINQIGEGSELHADEAREALIAAHQTYAIIENLPKFPGSDVNTLMGMAIDEGDALAVLMVLKDEDVDVDRMGLFRRMVTSGQARELITYKELLDDLSDNDCTMMVLDGHQYAALIKNLDDFKNIDSVELEQRFITALSDGLSLTESDFAALNEYVTSNIPTSRQPYELRLANRYMGFSGATLEGYRIVSDLHNERDIPLEAARVGVANTGVKGLEQFGESCTRISRQLMDVSMTPSVLKEIDQSELYQGILQNLYRVGSAEFGDTSESGVKQLLEYYMQAQEDGRIVPLDEQYTPAVVEIATLKAEKERVQLTEDVFDRYTVLHEDATKVIGLLEGRNAFSHLTQALGNKISDEIEATQQQLTLLAQAHPSDKATEYKNKNLHTKEAALTSLIAAAKEGKYIGRNFALRSPSDMSKIFSQLEPFDNLHAEMRQLTFAWALRKNPHMIEQLKDLKAKPGIEDLGLMRTFVDSIVNNETFANYFSDKKTAMKFKKLTSVRALDEALVRHQSQASVEAQQTLQIMPTRSFSMELSGHVADACWASQYDSMAEQFPNMTALMLKRGEDGSTNERLVGSAMLIETSDDQGEPVLLLRGINPIENYINKVQVSDFYNAMTSYCKSIAQRKGMKPAIVIDTQAGASGTNRPALHEYMAKMKEYMSNVTVDQATTTFNGYDVTEKSYSLL